MTRFLHDWTIFSVHYLGKKRHLAHWIIEASDFELTDLKVKDVKHFSLYQIAQTWMSIGNALNRMGQMKVIRVARAYITSKFESIHIPAAVIFYLRFLWTLWIQIYLLFTVKIYHCDFFVCLKCLHFLESFLFNL